MMAKAIGVGVEELNKMLENGEVISKDVLPLMADAMIEFANTAGALDKAVNSNLANQERLANAWFFFKANIAESGFMDVMTETFVSFTKMLNGSTKSGKTAGKVFSGLAMVFKAVGTILGTLFIAISEMPAAFQALIAALTLLLLPFATTAIAILAVIIILEDFIAFLDGNESIIGTWIEQTSLLAKAFLGLAAALAAILIFSMSKKVFAFAGGISKATTGVANLTSKMGPLLKIAGQIGALFAAWELGQFVGGKISDALPDNVDNAIGAGIAHALAAVGVDSAQAAVRANREINPTESFTGSGGDLPQAELHISFDEGIAPTTITNSG